MSTLRRRYEKWCKGDDIADCTHKQRYEASYQSIAKVLQQNAWIDHRKFLKLCVRARTEQGNINHPAYGTWTAHFMLRQNESRAFLGKYLNDPRVPWRHKWREMMAIAGIIPVAKWLAKIKQQSDVSCRLCKRAREQRGASTENLPEETYGHINSAFFAITSSKSSMYKQVERTRFCRRMCNAYEKHMTQKFDPTISKYKGRLGLTRRRRWRTSENRCMCK